MEDYEYVGNVCEGPSTFLWKCVERATGRLVAIKGFKRAHEEPEVMRRAAREIRILQTLDHPAIVPLGAAFKSGKGRVYMVFPYVSRSALMELDERRLDGLDRSDLKLLTWQLLQALVYLHRTKVVHRDIQPAKILLTDTGQVQLCGFGSARPIRCGPRGVVQDLSSSYVVKCWYRAPEVLAGDSHGASCDMWSLGCTLAELASGRPLFPGKSPGEQLWRIMRCFGPLPPSQAARMRASPRLARVRVPVRGRKLPQRLLGCDPVLLQLIEACLQLDPGRRPAAAELLKSPYFHDIASLLEETPLIHVYGGLRLPEDELPVAQQKSSPQPRQQRQQEQPTQHQLRHEHQQQQQRPWVSPRSESLEQPQKQQQMMMEMQQRPAGWENTAAGGPGPLRTASSQGHGQLVGGHWQQWQLQQQPPPHPQQHPAMKLLGSRRPWSDKGMTTQARPPEGGMAAAPRRFAFSKAVWPHAAQQDLQRLLDEESEEGEEDSEEGAESEEEEMEEGGGSDSGFDSSVTTVPSDSNKVPVKCLEGRQQPAGDAAVEGAGGGPPRQRQQQQVEPPHVPVSPGGGWGGGIQGDDGDLISANSNNHRHVDGRDGIPDGLGLRPATSQKRLLLEAAFAKDLETQQQLLYGEPAARPVNSTDLYRETKPPDTTTTTSGGGGGRCSSSTQAPSCYSYPCDDLLRVRRMPPPHAPRMREDLHSLQQQQQQQQQLQQLQLYSQASASERPVRLRPQLGRMSCDLRPTGGNPQPQEGALSSLGSLGRHLHSLSFRGLRSLQQQVQPYPPATLLEAACSTSTVTAATASQAIMAAAGGAVAPPAAVNGWMVEGGPMAAADATPAGTRRAQGGRTTNRNENPPSDGAAAVSLPFDTSGNNPKSSGGEDKSAAVFTAAIHASGAVHGSEAAEPALPQGRLPVVSSCGPQGRPLPAVMAQAAAVAAAGGKALVTGDTAAGRRRSQDAPSSSPAGPRRESVDLSRFAAAKALFRRHQQQQQQQQSGADGDPESDSLENAAAEALSIATAGNAVRSFPSPPSKRQLATVGEDNGRVPYIDGRVPYIESDEGPAVRRKGPLSKTLLGALKKAFGGAR